jgi:Cd2+/Zn2+-exporting ATPase
MEAGIKSLDGIEEVSIDFVSKRLSLKIAHDNDVNTIMGKVTAIINRIESHVILVKEKAHKNEEGDEDDHHHHHDHSINKADILRFILGVGLYLGATIFKFSSTVEFILYFVAYLLVGSEVLLKSLRNIARGQVFDENFLMSIATIGAFAIGEYPEGVAVMLFYQIGEFFQDAAVNNSRKSIKALMDIRPDYANLKLGEEIKKVSPEEIKVGDIILIKPGEKVPLDGKVIQGSSMLDTTALTGESVPRDINIGDDILSGFINKNGLLTVEVRKEFGESTVSKILDLVQNASSKKAPTESFITKFARYYTPVVVFIALGLAVIPPLVINGATFSDWVYRALIFLVVSCPCALVVSIPLGFFGGIGGASKNGILIKGSNYLEALYYVDTVVFDKTGTLTKGVFEVTEIKTSNGFTKDELLEYAAYAESFSTHPIAMSIVKAYGKEIDKGDIQEYDEISGHGIKTKIKAREVLAGNSRLMQKEDISYTDSTALGSIVHIAIDKSYAGYIVISDELKQDSAKAIKGLHGLGIKKIAMLTGDMKSVGEKIAKELGLDEVHAELLPDQKVEKLEELEQQKSAKGKLVFVGDGINDAPVLARADIGIAMGGLGSDAAIEAADIVIMTDEPSKIISAIKIARRTRSIVWQNIIFAMLVKGVVLLLGAGGLATMWEAVFADVGVAVVAILNAARIINIKES